MRSVKSGFVTADPDLIKSLFSGDGGKISNHFLRGIEASNFFRLNDDLPGPTKEAPQTTSDTVRSGNSSIIKSRTESIIFSLLSRGNQFPRFFGQCDGIVHFKTQNSKPRSRIKFGMTTRPGPSHLVMLNLVQHLVCIFLTSADASFTSVRRAGFLNALLINQSFQYPNYRKQS